MSARALLIIAIITGVGGADAREVALPKRSASPPVTEVRCGEPAWAKVRRAVETWCKQSGCAECAWLRTAVRTCDRTAGLYGPDEEPSRLPIVALPDGDRLQLSFATGGAEGDRAASLRFVRSSGGWKVEAGTCEEYRL